MNTWTLTLQGVKSVRWSQLVGALLLAGAAQGAFAEGTATIPVLMSSSNTPSGITATFDVDVGSQITYSGNDNMAWSDYPGDSNFDPKSSTYTPAYVEDLSGSNVTSFRWSSTGTGREEKGTMTVTFSQPVTNPVLHINNFGGGVGSTTWGSGEFTLKTAATGLQLISSFPSYMTVDAENKKIYGSTTLTAQYGSGSVRVLGTFSKLEFDVAVISNGGGGSFNEFVNFAVTGDPAGGGASPASIPTLGEWAMIFMASLMAMFGIARMRKQR